MDIEPTREQLAIVYKAAEAVLQRKRDSHICEVATKWEIVEHVFGMNHLMVDECMRVLADKGVYTLRKTINHIPIFLPNEKDVCGH